MIPAVIALIERVIAGADLSPNEASEIEAALDDSYPDDDFVQQSVEMLALYRPEAGDLLFDAAAIRQRLAETMNYLQKR